MRIYTRVVYGWQPDGSLRQEEADSFEYEGPMAHCGKDSPSPPPSPNYTQLAQQQGASNIETAQVNAKLSNPNITTPLGTRTVSYGSGAPTFNQSAYDAAMKAYTEGLRNPQPQGDGTTVGGKGGGVGGTDTSKPPNPSDFYMTSGDPNQSNVNITLSPEQQKLYEGQTALSQGLLNLGQGSLDQTSASLSKPQDFQSIQDLADQSYGQQTSRLDPQWQQASQQKASELANQGIVQGSEAYDNAMRVFNQGKNDAYTQARLAAQATMPQNFQLQTAERMQPLTELNAIRTGSQPQMPQFQSFTGSNAQPAPIMQAGQLQNQYDLGLYNSQVGQQNSAMSGLFGLGGALGSAAMNAGLFSDRRLKSNVVRIGDHPLGIGIYEYDIFGHRERGVMADEVLTVRPEAVMRGADGWLRVDYGRL